jgi:very-short-patch-repair endonuclease
MGKLTVNKLINYKKLAEVKNKINKHHLKELERVCQFYNTKTIKNRLTNIYNFIKYDVEPDWVERMGVIVSELKKDSSSPKSFEIRYGKKWAPILFKEKNEKCAINQKHFTQKFGEMEGPKKWEEYLVKSKTPWGLNSCIEKFGEIEGPKKWEERLTKKNNTMIERKKIKPYRNGRTLDEYQNRYGIEDGYNRWLTRNKKNAYRFTLEYYINEYGYSLGNEKWVEYCKNNDKTSLKSFIKRYGEETGLYKYNIFLEKLRSSTHNRYYSKISQELFWRLYNKLDKDSNIRFAELNGECFFYPNKEWRKVFAVDFKFNNKIIEFDGDYWHSNDNSKMIDNLRDEYLKKKGYLVLRIKESEYRETPKLVENKCIKFLKK